MKTLMKWITLLAALAICACTYEAKTEKSEKASKQSTEATKDRSQQHPNSTTSTQNTSSKEKSLIDGTDSTGSKIRQ